MKNNVKEFRINNKLTQTELADSVLTTRQTIYLIEKNKIVPSLELAFKLAKYFDVLIEDLFLYNDMKNQTKDVFFLFEKE